MTAYEAGDCPTCVVEPLLFVRNTIDGKIALYCNDCGGVYTTPDAVDFAYGDRSIDLSTFRPATLAEIKQADLEKLARPVRGPVKFP